MIEANVAIEIFKFPFVVMSVKLYPRKLVHDDTYRLINNWSFSPEYPNRQCSIRILSSNKFGVHIRWQQYILLDALGLGRAKLLRKVIRS